MRHFLFISFLFLFSIGVAQSNKPEGIWKEYKREIVGETNVDDYSINLSEMHLYHHYEFFSDSVEDGYGEYVDYGNTGHALFRFSDDGYYIQKGDTLELHETFKSDNITYFDTEVYTISYPKPNEMVLTSVCKSSEFGYIHYFKKTRNDKQANYSSQYSYPHPADFPGGLAAQDNFISKNINDTLLLNNNPENYQYFNLDILLSIDKSGKVTSATYIRENKHPLKVELKEAMRLIKMMPEWIPAKNNRKHAVKSKKLITISFLPEEATP